MNEIKVCTQNELIKVLAQKKYRIIPIIAAVLTIGGSLLSLIPGNVIHFSMENYPYSVMSVLVYVLLPIIAFMMAADLVAGEEEKNQLKIAFTRPVNRSSVLLGKLFGMIIYVGALILGLAILSLIVSIPAAGLGAFNVATLLLAWVVTLLPVMMVTALALLVSAHTHTSTTSFVICLILYAGIWVLGLWASSIAMVLPTSYMTMYKMILGSQIPWSSLAIGGILLVGYAILFISVATFRFERKEV